MKRAHLVLGLTLIIAFSFGLAHGQNRIYVTNVTGLVGTPPDDSLQAGVTITWTIALRVAAGDNVLGSNNGFIVYSPDGATWGIPVLDTLNIVGTTGFGWKARFDGIVQKYHAPSNNGLGTIAGADTVGIGGFSISGIDGLGTAFPGGFNFDVLTITLPGGSPGADNGKHICLDSSGYQTNSEWLWSAVDSKPDWSGPHCYYISNSATQLPVDLASAANYVVLAGSTITNTGNTTITGDVGLSPGTAVTGFPPGIIVGTLHISDPSADQAKLDLTTAYNDAAGRTLGPVSVSGNLGGMTLAPGLYKSTSGLEISSGDLTLDAQGDTNSVWIFQIASTLNTTSGRKVILSGGAKAANIFWQVGTSATLGTTSVFKGTIMADQSIVMATGALLEGRVLARIGEVTFDSDTINADISTAIIESNTDILPNSFELEQNFPNPFNPTTSIKFGLPTKSHVSIIVYNLLGQEITTLVDKELSAGTHTTEWDGRDNSRTEVASGIYFYKIIAGDFVGTKKMMLVK